MIHFVVGALVLLVILLAMSIRILREYERAVVFFLGRFLLRRRARRRAQTA